MMWMRLFRVFHSSKNFSCNFNGKIGIKEIGTIPRIEVLVMR